MNELLLSKTRANAGGERYSSSRSESIARIDALATLLDSAIVIPGTSVRIGVDGLAGLIPGIGDTITTLMALYIVREARSLGAPSWLIGRMLANVAIDGVVGAIPILGDVFDVAFKANRRNISLLKRWLDSNAQPRSDVRAWKI